MYLVQQMNAVLDAIGSHGIANRYSDNLQWMLSKMKTIIDTRELLILERSALTAAGHLKLGEPDRLDATLDVVLATPQRIFVECVHAQRVSEMHDLYPAYSRMDNGRGDPQRIGLDIDVYEPGKAIIQPYWCFPKGDVGPLPMDPNMTKLEHEGFATIFGFGISLGRIAVDMSKSDRLSFDDFKLKVSEQGMPRALREASEQILRDREMNETNLMETAFREYRLNQHSSYLFDDTAHKAAHEISMSGQSLDDVVESSYKDLDGELIYAVACLAIIQARKDTDAFSSEDQRRRPRKVTKRPRLRDMSSPELSILSLVRSSGRSAFSSGSAAGGSAQSAGRMRHAVKGHLFLARNRKMVYRKAHFRGTLNKKAARKVK
jgi:hypothetical protein